MSKVYRMVAAFKNNVATIVLLWRDSRCKYFGIEETPLEGLKKALKRKPVIKKMRKNICVFRKMSIFAVI